MSGISSEPSLVPYPANDDPGHWIAYWRSIQQSWRQEPEIGEDRQHYLLGCVQPIGKERMPHHPFAQVKLHRGDIEWLLWIRNNRRILDRLIIPPEMVPCLLDFQDADLNAEDIQGLDFDTICHHESETEKSNDEHAELISTKLGQTTLGPLETPEPQFIDHVKTNAIDLSMFYPHTETTQVDELKSQYANGERSFFGRSLAGAQLQGSNLSGADLAKCDLTFADLSGADLSNANLGGAILYGANLSRAKLIHTKLKLANLISANLSFAVIDSTDLSGADLNGADLQGTSLAKENSQGQTLESSGSRERFNSVIGPRDFMEDWWSKDPDDR